MPEGKIPQNQLDALPLITADTAAAGGDIVVVGGNLTRFWSGTALGFPTALVVQPDGSGIFSSNRLDVTGCSRFVLLVTRTIILAAGDVAQTIQVFLCYENLAGTFSQVTNFTLATSLLLHQQRLSESQTWAISGVGSTRLASIAWNDSILQAGGGGGGTATLGYRFRLVLRDAGPVPAAGSQSYAFEMWGAGF